MRSERMPQAVPADLAKTCSLARTPQRMPRRAVRQHPPIEIAEHERSTEVTVRLERRLHLVAEWDLARLARLWRADETTHDVLPDRQPTGNQIDILPAQADQLAVPHAGAQRDEDHRAPLTFCRRDQPFGFREVEEVEVRSL